jgi:hypothetical protein
LFLLSVCSSAHQRLTQALRCIGFGDSGGGNRDKSARLATRARALRASTSLFLLLPNVADMARVSNETAFGEWRAIQCQRVSLFSVSAPRFSSLGHARRENMVLGRGRNAGTGS